MYEQRSLASREPHPKRWAILWVVLAVECMDLLDATIVNVALPTIRADLDASTTAVQWVAAGYALALAVLLVTGARLGDIYGRRRLFLLGTAGFTACSALCGLAPSDELLIACRPAPGRGRRGRRAPGARAPARGVPRQRAAKAFAVFGPVIGLSAVLGPILGGLLVDADLFGTGWRLVFLVNIPVGIAAIAAAARLLPESRDPDPPSLDLAARRSSPPPPDCSSTRSCRAASSTGPRGPSPRWPAASGLLGVFAAHLRRRERAHRSPLVTPSLFAKRPWNGGLVVFVLFFGGLGGVTLTLTLYLQLGLGYSAIKAGLTLVPLSIGMAFGAGLSGAVLGARFGRPVLHVGWWSGSRARAAHRGRGRDGGDDPLGPRVPELVTASASAWSSRPCSASCWRASTTTRSARRRACSTPPSSSARRSGSRRWDGVLLGRRGGGDRRRLPAHARGGGGVPRRRRGVRGAAAAVRPLRGRARGRRRRLAQARVGGGSSSGSSPATSPTDSSVTWPSAVASRAALGAVSSKTKISSTRAGLNRICDW
jgi:MFS family permease